MNCPGTQYMSHALSVGMFDRCTACGVGMTIPTHAHYKLAERDAGLGVGHIWTATQCPAYRTFDPADCTCRAGR